MISCRSVDEPAGKRESDMTDESQDAGVIQVLVDRLEKQRLLPLELSARIL